MSDMDLLRALVNETERERPTTPTATRATITALAIIADRLNRIADTLEGPMDARITNGYDQEGRITLFEISASR